MEPPVAGNMQKDIQKTTKQRFILLDLLTR